MLKKIPQTTNSLNALVDITVNDVMYLTLTIIVTRQRMLAEYTWFDQLIVEDEDLEDDYGMGSDPGQYSDLEGSRILTTDGSHIFKL